MKKISILVIFWLLLGLMFALPAWAQGAFGTNTLTNLAVYSTRSITDTIVGIVNIILGFLGVIAVLLFLYSGWLWLSSRGDAQKIQKSKLIMASTVIGLLIIFASYAITNFIIARIAEETGTIETTPPGYVPPGPGPVTCPLPANDGDIDVCQVYPGAAAPGNYFTITGWNFGNYVAGNSRAVLRDNLGNETALDLVSCDGNPIWNLIYTTPDGDNSFYEIRAIVPDITAAVYDVRVYRNATVFDQETNNSFTVSPPGAVGLNIACLRPSFGAARPTPESVIAEGINFGTSAGTISMKGWVGSSEADITVPSGTWDDTLITFQIPDNALASDVKITHNADINNWDTRYFMVTCGGDDGNCSSGCCSNYNECRPNTNEFCPAGANFSSAPRIDAINPNNGAAGNLVTILGQNFGTVAGTVWFNGASGPIQGVVPSILYPGICPAGNYWYDNYIIIGVPVGTIDGSVYIMTGAAIPEQSNNASFDENGISRPGLCQLNPIGGSFQNETRVNTTGINFASTDKILFSVDPDITGNDYIYTSPNEASAVVPNLQNGQVGVQIKNNADQYSNPLPFQVSDSFFGQPRIVTTSPNGIKSGVYITIFGTNFGNLAGQVLFNDVNNATNPDLVGIVPSNPMCQNAYWQNNQIVVETPNLPDISNGSPYEIVVKRADAVVSEAYDINYNTSLEDGVFLCAVVPDNGPNNFSPVDFYGSGFSDNSVRIQFNGAANTVNPTGFNDTQAWDTTVPGDALSGQVILQSQADNGTWLNSNALNFNIAGCSQNSDCQGSEQCCPGNFGNYCSLSCDQILSCTYTSTLHTQNIPFSINYNYNCDTDWQSPTPWPDGLLSYSSQDNYVDSNISFTFTRNIVDADLEPAAHKIRLYECDNRNTSCDVEINIATNIIGQNSNQEGVLINPLNNLAENTWYKVVLVGDFRAEGGNEYWNTSYDPDLQVVGGWNFRTKSTDLACEISSIQVTPQSAAANFYLGNSRDFYSAPTANNCNLCGGNYNWTWQLTNPPNPDAANVTDPSNIGTNIGHTRLTSDLPINYATEFLSPNYVNLQCNVNQAIAPSFSQPVVLAPILLVENYGPICSASCDNGTVWIDFNTPIASTYLNNTYFSIQDCNNDASCASPSATNLVANVVLPQDGNSRITLPHSAFTHNHYYRVQALDTIRNIHGYQLDDTKTWVFGVADASCEVASVDLNPNSAIVAIGNQITYGAQAYSDPNACYIHGQPIDCLAANNCTWLWASSNNTIATIPNNNSSVNDATGVAVGISNISANARQAGVDHIDSGVLTVVESITTPVDPHLPPRVENIRPLDAETNICPNAAITMDFTELMDPASVMAHVKLYAQPDNYDVNGDGVADLQDVALISGNINLWDLADVNYGVTNFDSNADNIPDKTTVILYPTSLLRIVNKINHVVVQGNVTSIYNIALDSGQYNFEGQIPDMPGNDSYSWHFTTGADLCRISYIQTIPTSDWFLCAGDNCGITDVEPATPGHQHSYTAIARDVRGIALAGSISYDWSLNNDGINLLLNNDGSPAAGATPNVHFKVANENGRETLIVNAQGSDVGSASANIGIDVFLCEVPWPGPGLNLFPWQDDAYNFSTYYCPDVDQNDGIASLPILNNNPIENPNHPASVLREYIFSVPAPVSMDSGNNFGSLSTSKYNQTDSWWSHLFKKVSKPWQALVARGQGIGTDIIALRIMSNLNHLSVEDWYELNAPNPDIGGTSLEVDGYPALQVGNTVYISAFNLDDAGNVRYTNIYILAYNIGARPTTVEIFSQLLDNFRLNTNVDQQNNICVGGVDAGNVCSSDFDCAEHNCQSQGLKLRRDLVRLGDMLNINSKLIEYGETHKACSNNSLTACVNNSQCPNGGTCINYYPLLNAGTFVRGQSNSSWPSWQQTLATGLSGSLPLDPINLFNACGDPGFDPNTCWNEEALEFSCPIGSLIYHYQRSETGDGYDLSANFESISNFATLLDPMDSNINTELLYCNAASANLINPRCGNGRIDWVCSNRNYNNQTDCEANSGTWYEEECDGGYQDNQCNPILSATYGVHTWWNEQRTGCYPAGSIVGGNSVECTWYEPDVATMFALCGGYCGNNALESNYEDCENINGNTNFGGVNYSCANGIAPTCSPTSCQAVCGPMQTPAAACGDGIWTELVEECDASAPNNANGLSELDCTENGNVSCNNNCEAVCDTGVAYDGQCGDGNLNSDINPVSGDPYEECDYGAYAVPSPAQSSLTNPYTCLQNCTFGSDYCNDTIKQGGFDEICDTTLAISPTPPNSSRYSQYQCRTVNDAADPLWTKCTPTAGGYCGDGTIQNGQNGTFAAGEICDSAYHPTPAESGPENTYSCSYTCMTRTGGYCGDTIIQDGNNGTTDYGETCDYAAYAPPLPVDADDINHQYVCSDVCLADSGGWCGDSILQPQFGEDCDYGNPSTHTIPDPWNSNSSNPYTCPSCSVGSYCGDGVIDVAYGEQCDAGMTPPARKVELAFVYDMSRSMQTAAAALCGVLDTFLDNFDPSTTFRVSIFVLGDDAPGSTGSPRTLTPGTSDDLRALTDNGTCSTDAPDTVSCEHRNVYNSLVRGCTALWDRHVAEIATYSDSTNLNKFRFLSFYDNNASDPAYNHITGGVTNFTSADDHTSLNGCNDAEPGGRLENWGYATEKIINNYQWLSGYQRIVIPVSDEYAWCGGDVAIPTAAANENNCNTPNTCSGTPATGQLASDDIISRIISSATNPATKAFVSPVILAGADNQAIALQAANATGGYMSTAADASSWNTNINNMVGGVFCDSHPADGVMDCMLPGGAPPAAGLPTLSLPYYYISSDSNSSNRSVTITLGGTATWWDAVSNDPTWITNVSKSGNTLSFTIAANTGSAIRTGSIKLTAGAATGSPITVNLSIDQLAPAPVPTLSLPYYTLDRDSSAATISMPVTIGGSATWWQAISNNTAWISGISQVGNTLSFNIAANTGPDRTGTISVRAGAPTGAPIAVTLTINQAAPVIPPDTMPPTPIGNTLVATPADGQIRLDWAVATDDRGAVIYEVERLGPTTGNYLAYSNTFNQSGLSNGVSYSYRVRARDLAGNITAWTNTASATPVPAAIPPIAPANLEAFAQAGGIYLTWGTATVGDPISYFRLERSTNFSFSTVDVVADINFASFTGSYTDSFPLANPTVTYYYRVKSVNSGSGLESTYVGPVNATIPDTTAPSVPTNLTSTYLSDTQYRFSWTVSTDNIAIDHYEVEYQADAFVSDGTGTNIGNPTTNSIDFTLDPTVATYSFRVRAFDAGGNQSAWSSALVAFAVDVLPPTNPTNLTASVSFGNVNLNWTAASDNIGVSGYDLLRATTSGGPYTLIVCPSMSCNVTGSTARSNTSVAPGTYYYVVKAFDAAGNRSDISNQIAVTILPPAPPSVPTNFTGMPIGRLVSLNWTASIDDVSVTNYEVQYKPNLTGTWTLVGSPTTNALSYSVPALVTQPYFRVRAKDNDNNYSNYSTELTVTIDGTGCTETFCNQWDAINSANRTACANQCVNNSGCCQACVDPYNSYVGCRLNPDAVTNSCSSSQVSMPLGVRCD